MGSPVKIEAEETRPCEQCGTPMEGVYHTRRFCDDCQLERRRARQRTKNRQPIDCEVCGVEFMPYRSGQKYCDTCRVTGNRDKRKETAWLPEEDHEEAQRQRMEKMGRTEALFGYYKAKSDASIPARPDGTKFMVVSDHQIPFVDKPFLNAWLEAVEAWRPHDVIFAGDVLDCYEASMFDKRPMRLFNLQDEIEMARQVLRDTETAQHGAERWWADGNHEERYNKVIWKKAGEIAFMISDLAEGLHLDEHTSGFVPYGRSIEMGGFLVTHGNVARKWSAYTARAHWEQYSSSGANGHTHRAGSFSRRDGNNRSHTWYEIGCFCRMDLEYLNGPPDWQHAFLAGTWYNGAVHPQLIRVIETKQGRGFVLGDTYYPIRDAS